MLRHMQKALAVLALTASLGHGAPVPVVPLCPGLRIVTAVDQADGDYESIKTIESVTDAVVTIKYSTERTVSDLFSTAPPKLQKYTVRRMVRRKDLQSAVLYLQQFSTELPELVPATTAIGTSTDVLEALKGRGQSRFGYFITFTQIKPSIDRNIHPNVYDNQMISTLKRIGTRPVRVPLLVNDMPMELPAIRAQGTFFGDKSEFFFLDDPGNPLALRFRIGIDGMKALDAARAKAQGTQPHHPDRDVLQVVKITYPCAGPSAHAPGTPGTSSALEQSLASTGHAEVYSIYFSFNSDGIREESGPTLAEIAEVLRRHPDWRLAVNGHTDNIGGDKYNLDLSSRRAAAVREALVSNYKVPQTRLTTAGYGRSQPVDTNETLEGRARNRRVELVRLP